MWSSQGGADVAGQGPVHRGAELPTAHPLGGALVATHIHRSQVGGLRVEKDQRRLGPPELQGILSHGSSYQTVVLEFDRPVRLEGNLSLVKATGEVYGYPVAPSDATVAPRSHTHGP